MRASIGNLKRAVKSALSVVVPRYRGGNQYDLDVNRGLLRIDTLDPLPEVAVCLPFGMAILDWSAWSHSWARSRTFLKRIMPPEFADRLPHLHPVVVRNFVLADIDARENGGTRFPARFVETVLGPYVRLSKEADGTCRIDLTADFGGYFHFLIEILPLVLAIRRTRRVHVTVSPELAGRYRFIASAFAHAGVDCRVGAIPVRAGLPIVDLVPGSEVAYYYPNLASARILQSTFVGGSDSVDLHPRRIFLSRRPDANTNGRILVNEAEVLARLANLGFVAFHAEDYTFEQQRRIFAAAEIVVGVSGAGLSNTVFMKRGSMVVELMPRAEFKWHFALLAKYCDLAYSLLEVEVLEVVDHRPMWLKVDVERLANLILAGMRRPNSHLSP